MDRPSRELSLLASLLFAACAFPRTAVVTPVRAMALVAPHARTIDVSAGDPVRGRGAFIDLQCHVCHRVAEDETLPPADSASDAPLLHDLSAEPAEAVGWKIVTRTRLAPESMYESEMVDSASAMTELQFVDLIAYLRNPAAARAGANGQ